jgi:hypothetical protein
MIGKNAIQVGVREKNVMCLELPSSTQLARCSGIQLQSLQRLVMVLTKDLTHLWKTP